MYHSTIAAVSRQDDKLAATATSAEKRGGSQDPCSDRELRITGTCSRQKMQRHRRTRTWSILYNEELQTTHKGKSMEAEEVLV